MRKRTPECAIRDVTKKRTASRRQHSCNVSHDRDELASIQILKDIVHENKIERCVVIDEAHERRRTVFEPKDDECGTDRASTRRCQHQGTPLWQIRRGQRPHRRRNRSRERAANDADCRMHVSPRPRPRRHQFPSACCDQSRVSWPSIAEMTSTSWSPRLSAPARRSRSSSVRTIAAN